MLACEVGPLDATAIDASNAGFAPSNGDLTPFGSGGGAGEVDATYFVNKKGAKRTNGYQHKMAVVALVDRDSGTNQASTSISVYPVIPLR